MDLGGGGGDRNFQLLLIESGRENNATMKLYS
jgi:hypothetical protein